MFITCDWLKVEFGKFHFLLFSIVSSVYHLCTAIYRGEGVDDRKTDRDTNLQTLPCIFSFIDVCIDGHRYFRF